MKKFASICLLGAAIASCTAPTNKGYEINGTYADSVMDSSMLYLMDGDSIVDSTMVNGKTFSFKGETDTILLYRIAGKAMMRGQLRYNTLTKVILQQGTNLSVDVDRFVKLSDNGGVNEIWNQFQNDYRDTVNADMIIYQNMIANKTSKDSLAAFVYSQQDKMNNIWEKAVQTNRDNLAGAAIFSDFCYAIEDAAKFDSVTSTLKYAELFPNVVAQKKTLEHLAATAEGQKFVDFGGKDLEGKDAKLSDFVGQGKYVLVDFWASWCGPCRAEIPNILKVNKKYAGKKFMVLGVDVWDQEDKFKTALEEEKVNYAQLFTTGGEATELYGIQGIPHIVLFGPDGTILKRGLRGEAIEATVKEYLKK